MYLSYLAFPIGQGSIKVQVHTHSTGSLVPSILFNGGFTPPTKRPEVTEGWIVVIVSVPQLMTASSGITTPHYLTPLGLTSVHSSRLFTLCVCVCDSESFKS